MSDVPTPGAQVDELRRAFDRAFAAPPAGPPEDHVDLLAIRVADQPFAVRLLDVSALVRATKVVPLPPGRPELLGLAGLRGGLVPVFGLAALLGYPQPAEPPRWLLLCGGADTIALAFHDFDGHVRLPKSALHADAGGAPGRRHVADVARTPQLVRAVVGIASIIETIRSRRAAPAAAGELT
jgi:chemotaxis signal transduction protein